MKKSVEITIVVICSCIIVLAIVGGIFSILNVLKYDEIIGAYAEGDPWFETEEYLNCKTMIDAHEIQWIHTLGIVICVVALMTAALCWLRLKNEVGFPKLFAKPAGGYIQGKFMTKTLLKIQIPVEIVSICLGIVSYFVLQFAYINNTVLILTALMLIPPFLTFIMVPLNVFALKWQYKNYGKAIDNPKHLK